MEESFFAKREAELVAKLKQDEEIKKNKDALAQASGIKNQKVLDHLAQLGVSPSILANLLIVPLVEIAWSDGALSERKKKVVREEAARGGLIKEAVDQNLLETWLKERPSPKYWQAWGYYIEGLKEIMIPKELNDLKNELLSRAKKVAQASSGVIGLAIKFVSTEKDLIKKIESAFKV